jgi:hypothetical protein
LTPTLLNVADNAPSAGFFQRLSKTELVSIAVKLCNMFVKFEVADTLSS